MKHIDTLVEDIYDLFTRDGGPPIPKEQVEKEIDIFLDELKEHLTDFLYTKKKTSSNLRLPAPFPNPPIEVSQISI